MKSLGSIILTLLCVCAHADAQEPHISLRTATPEQTTVARYGKFELTLDLKTGAKNPFDPDQIDVETVFTSPQGKTVSVPGFLYQEFTRSQENGRERVTPTGLPLWMVRFTPDTVGNWQYRVTAKDATGMVALPLARFQCTPSSSAGFVRRARNNPAGFAFDSGRAYFPVGENMCWFGDGGTYEYDRWLADLHHAGGDWIRLWMWENRCGIEWSGKPAEPGNYIGYHGVGVYSLDNAWKLDRIFDIASQNDTTVMLCLGTYGEFTSGGFFNEGTWGRNPYNAANGGPCKTPESFWTDPTARKLYRQRLRYLVARYGWRTNLFAWEFWNEANPPAAWVDEMARYLKGSSDTQPPVNPADPYRHLVSNSYGSPAIWRLPDIDFTMTHNYGTGDIIDHAPAVHADAQENAVYDKPHLMAEFGIDWRDPDTKYDPDGKGVNLHNAIWSAVASGDAGSAMIWWWDSYIGPKGLYAPFHALRGFTDLIAWNEAPWKPLEFDPPRAPEAAEQFTDMTLPATMGWGKAAVSEFTLTPQGKVSAGQIPSFLYSAGKADLRTTPAFHVNFTHPGRFMVHVNQVSDFVKLQFLLDGKPATAFDLHAAPPADKSVKPDYAKTEFESQYNVYLATYDKDYGIDVPAGEHTVTVNVAEGDWASLTGITLTGYRSSLYPDINLYGITNGNEAILWAQNPAHNWKNVYEHKPIPPLPASSLTLHSLKDSSYIVRWWDTVKGMVTRQERITVRGGQVTLQLPSIAEDIAAQIVVDKIQ